MRFLRLLREHLKQAISWRLLVCGVSVALVLAVAISGMIGNTESFMCVWYLLDKSICGSGTMTVVICILPAISYSITLATEWETHATSYWIVRMGITPYVISKMIISAIAGLLTLVIGMLLFIGIFSIWYPIYVSPHTYFAYETLLEEGRIGAGLVGYILHYALSGALVSACGTFVATIIPNPFVAVSSPLIIHFTLTRLTATMHLPQLLNPLFWLEGITSTPSAGRALLEKLVVVVVLCTGLCLMAVWQMKRRVRNA